MKTSTTIYRFIEFYVDRKEVLKFELGGNVYKDELERVLTLEDLEIDERDWSLSLEEIFWCPCRSPTAGSSRGLTFVAISRVRAIGDIVFRSEIGPGRLQKLGGSTNLLKEDIIRKGGLNFMDAEDAEELEFLLNWRYIWFA
jgi:hypothetical protein